METKSILAAVVIIVCGAALSVEGRTDVSSPISVDTVWDVNGSPYVLTGNVNVEPAATLLIAPAVEVNSLSAVYTLSAAGRLMARDADINSVHITATAGGSLDLLGCSVIGGTVTVDAGAAARVKYSSLSSLSLNSDANTYVTGNDFNDVNVVTSGDLAATINIEANWWGRIEPNGPSGIDPNYFVYVHGKITDHCDNNSLPYADFSPYLGQLPPQDSNDDGAIGDLLGQVFIFNDVNGARPYPAAIVTVDDPNQPSYRLTDSEGKFAFSGIPVGKTTISVGGPYELGIPSVFYDMSEKVLVGENSETFVYMRVTPKLQPPSADFAATSSSGYPSVVEIRSKHFGPDRYTYYLDGVPLEQTVTATVDWGIEDTNAREVKWYRDTNNFATTDVSESNQITYESLTFDIDDELDAYTQLKVKAWSYSMGDSAEKTANLDVIVPPPGVPPILLKPDTSQSVIFYRIVGSDFWAFEAIMEGVDAVGGIPCFSGKPFELGAKAYASAQVRGDGTASVVFLDGYELPSIEVGDVEITPSVSLELGWEYISDNWGSWGELVLGAEGSYTTPPHYTIVLVGPVPVPVYWRLGMGMDFDQGFDLDVNDGWNEPPVPNWNAQDKFMFELWLELMLGVGIADVAAVEGYFGGGAEMHMAHDVELQALYIKLYGGLRVVVWIFEYEKEAIYYKWKMPVGGKSLSSSMIRMAMNTGGSGELAVFTRSYQERNDYAIDILTEADLPAYLATYLEDINLFDLGEERPLQHNVFPYSQPAIAADGNDLLLVWVYDDPCRDTGEPNSLNRTRIMFSRYDGEWSEPNYIDSDDQSPDFSPQLAVIGPNKALCVWEDADSNLADANLADMAAVMGISAAYYNNGTWEPSTPLSDDNSQLDRSPRLAAGTSKAMAVWISNSENNIGIDPNANTEPNNTVYCRIWEDPNWGALETVGTGIGVIGKTALAMSSDGNKAIYVYELDSDATLGTDTDRELYAFSYSDGNWSSDPCRLTYNGVLADTNPQVVYKDNNSIFLAWNCNGYIVSVDGLDLSTLQNNTLAPANVSGVGQVAPLVDVHTDGWVDFMDFTVLAGQWLYADCAADNNWCEYCDFDWSGMVDYNDVRIFSDFWLTEQAPFIGSAGARDFCLAKASDGRISVVWPERAADGNGIDVFTATYLPSFSVWSFPYPLTFDESLERSLAATYVGSSGTQQLALAYNEVAFDFNEVSISDPNDPNDPCGPELLTIPEPNRVDLYTLTHQRRHDLRITAGDISFEPRNPLPGSTVEITAVIHNTGDFAEENVPVFFYRENPFNPFTLLTIQDTNIPGPILPGGQGIITISWEVPKIVFGPQQIHIKADPCNIIEDEDDEDGSDPNDNDANTSVMAPDLAVSMINAKEIDPNRGLTARIKNSGGLRVDGARVVVCYGDHGEPNCSNEIEKFDISLDPNAFYDIRYMWTPTDANGTPLYVDTTLYVVADPNDANNPNGAIDEFDEENNIGFGLIRLE